ncbi:hypothetical protein, partial [Rhizobium skierniewicense]|uniref:hypothetical protein n=1 Tax=Rhizobium skierniewicense TaxID=984260 RepID=UPI001AEE81BF
MPQLPPSLLFENTSERNQYLTQKPQKNSKKHAAVFSTARGLPAHWSRSALGYTARRCGEAEPALVVRGYATPHR